MARSTAVWVVVATVLATAASPLPGWSGDVGGAKYSGTVVAVDRGAGTIVVEGMGPWRVKDGVTQLERRTIGIVPSTELMRLERASGVAPSGWPGDFVESALPEWQVKPGDWVTVAVKLDGARMTAIRIDVADPGEL
ncbi:MAG TPA: hypothetical protein VFO08_09640 [Methylomirabilota bacterium]|nr:hypothetical protein [Methylomirabilota bacterium]